MRETLHDIHRAMHQAHLRQHPDVELRLPGPTAALDRQERARVIAEALEVSRARLADMEAFQAGP